MTLDDERKHKTYLTINLNAHMERFLRTLESDATINNYRHVIKDFIQYLKDNDVEKLTEDNATEELNSYVTYLNKNTDLKSVSIDNYNNRIKSFLNQCLKLNVRKTKKYSSSRVKKEYKYLTLDEISKLIATIPETTKDEVLMARNKAILILLFTSGLRVSEMCNLTNKNIIHRNNEQYIKVSGKGLNSDEYDIMEMHDEAWKMITTYHSMRNLPDDADDLPIFTTNHGRKMSRQDVNHIIKKLAAATDEKYHTNISERATPHAMRHSLAVHLVNDEKVDINIVRDVLRHSNIQITNTYLTVDDDKKNNAIRNIDMGGILNGQS